MGLGVVLLVALAWVRLARAGRDGLPVPVVLGVALVLVLAVVVAVWWRGRSAAHGQRVVAEQRPGWLLHQVWAAAGTSDALVRHGVWEQRMSPTGGTRLTLAWSPAGLELWRSGRRPHVVVALPWDAVAAVTPGEGRAASTRRPALVVGTVTGVDLVVVPAARPDGALLPAGRDAVERLVAELRAARDAGQGPTVL